MSDAAPFGSSESAADAKAAPTTNPFELANDNYNTAGAAADANPFGGDGAAAHANPFGNSSIAVQSNDVPVFAAHEAAQLTIDSFAQAAASPLETKWQPILFQSTSRSCDAGEEAERRVQLLHTFVAAALQNDNVFLPTVLIAIIL